MKLRRRRSCVWYVGWGVVPYRRGGGCGVPVGLPLVARLVVTAVYTQARSFVSQTPCRVRLQRRRTASLLAAQASILLPTWSQRNATPARRRHRPCTFKVGSAMQPQQCLTQCAGLSVLSVRAVENRHSVLGRLAYHCTSISADRVVSTQRALNKRTPLAVVED